MRRVAGPALSHRFHRSDSGFATMRSKPRALDPLDLELVRRVYEAVLEELQQRNPRHDFSGDYQRRSILRRRVVAAVKLGDLDEDKLRNGVIATLPKFWT
jgi:hypothetical protein